MSKTYRATFLKREKWWVAWSEDVPGALTQGKALAEAKANLRDAIRLMLAPVNLDKLPAPLPYGDRASAQRAAGFSLRGPCQPDSPGNPR